MERVYHTEDDGYGSNDGSNHRTYYYHICNEVRVRIMVITNMIIISTYSFNCNLIMRHVVRIVTNKPTFIVP